jgi:hypothetical protein
MCLAILSRLGRQDMRGIFLTKIRLSIIIKLTEVNNILN